MPTHRTVAEIERDLAAAQTEYDRLCTECASRRSDERNAKRRVEEFAANIDRAVREHHQNLKARKLGATRRIHELKAELAAASSDASDASDTSDTPPEPADDTGAARDDTDHTPAFETGFGASDSNDTPSEPPPKKKTTRKKTTRKKTTRKKSG